MDGKPGGWKWIESFQALPSEMTKNIVVAGLAALNSC